MTVMTTLEGITAPPIPADPHRLVLPAETFVAAADLPDFESRRADGWSAANQRLFLEAIAEGHGVEVATMRVGLSAASAYAFRRTAKGAAFALGWRAASLVARDAIAETLLVRALDGQVDTVTRADGSTITRHRHDNRLGMSLLARLDRQVEAAPDADVKAARLVAQEFDAFLDGLARDAGPARAGLFLGRGCGGLTAADGVADPATAARDLAPIYALAAADRLARTGVATAEEVDVADLDPAVRAAWTAEQWQRAEAAGLFRLAVAPPLPAETAPASQLSQHSPAEDDVPVWWDEEATEWRTRFPPSDDFVGFEQEEPGHIDYQRSLTAEEEEVMGQGPDYLDPAELAALAAAREAWFGAGAGEADEELATAEDAADEAVTGLNPVTSDAAVAAPAGLAGAGD